MPCFDCQHVFSSYFFADACFYPCRIYSRLSVLHVVAIPCPRGLCQALQWDITHLLEVGPRGNLIPIFLQGLPDMPFWPNQGLHRSSHLPSPPGDLLCGMQHSESVHKCTKKCCWLYQFFITCKTNDTQSKSMSKITPVFLQFSASI